MASSIGPPSLLIAALNDMGKNIAASRNNGAIEEVMNITTSVTISPIIPKNTKKRKLNGSHHSLNMHKNPSISNGTTNGDDYFDIKKYLPPTVLEECVVELVSSAKDRDEEPSDDAVVIQPMYGKQKRREKRIDKTENDEAIDKKDETGDTYMRDIFNKVEAVYSDDDDQEMSSKNVPQYINGRESTIPEASPEASYACEHCPNKYLNKGALWQHNVATHSVEKSCECQLCGRKFYRNCSLALHMKCHSDEQNCSCKICGKEFGRLSMLEKHAKSHAIESGGAFVCKTCSKRFADRDSLRVHTLTHAEKYTCEQCNVSFNTKQLLDLHHHITHRRGDAAFACKLCKARFANLRELNEHSATHANEKVRISCHHCGEVFAQRCVYKKHLQLHVGERLSCTVCRIDFTQRSSLLRHYKRLHLMHDLPPLENNNGSATNANIDTTPGK